MKTVAVYTTYNDVEAEMIRNLLEENEIPCQLISDIAHAVFPFTFDHQLSQIRVMVDEEEVSRAEEILAEFLDGSAPLFTSDDPGDGQDDLPESD